MCTNGDTSFTGAGGQPLPIFAGKDRLCNIHIGQFSRRFWRCITQHKNRQANLRISQLDCLFQIGYCKPVRPQLLILTRQKFCPMTIGVCLDYTAYLCLRIQTIFDLMIVMCNGVQVDFRPSAPEKVIHPSTSLPMFSIVADTGPSAFIYIYLKYATPDSKIRGSFSPGTLR